MNKKCLLWSEPFSKMRYLFQGTTDPFLRYTWLYREFQFPLSKVDEEFTKVDSHLCLALFQKGLENVSNFLKVRCFEV